MDARGQAEGHGQDSHRVGRFQTLWAVRTGRPALLCAESEPAQDTECLSGRQKRDPRRRGQNMRPESSPSPPEHGQGLCTSF